MRPRFALVSMLFILMFASACQTTSEKMDNSVQATAPVSAPRPAKHRNPNNIIIEAEVLSLPRAQYDQLDTDLRSSIENKAPVQQTALDKLMVVSAPDLKILMRPRLVIRSGDIGTLECPGEFWLDLAPTIQPDKTVHSYVFLKVPVERARGGYNLDSYKNMVCISDECSVNPAESSYVCYREKPKTGNRDIYLFIRFQTADSQ